MKIEYVEWNPQPAARQLVSTANDIIAEYKEEGYTLTLRQLYYQFVSRDLIANTERSYKNLGTTITKARMAGMVSWYAIEDRNRDCNEFWFDENEINAIEALPDYLRFDRWARQENYVEVWVEKDALSSVVEKACDPFLVPTLACKGYLSASEAWTAGRRFKKQADAGKNCVMIHLGDHDPSGIDMTRDNTDRLQLFSDMKPIKVVRLALNMDQVDEYEPPPNPAKVSDPRAGDYIKKFGNTSWELDALEPKVIVKMIQTEINKLIDSSAWSAVADMEESQKGILRKLGSSWENVKYMLEEDMIKPDDYEEDDDE